jgi:hypothetical protein
MGHHCHDSMVVGFNTPVQSGFKLSTLVVIDNDCRGKPNYHNDHDHDGPLQLDTKKIVTFVF